MVKVLREVDLDKGEEIFDSLVKDVAEDGCAADLGGVRELNGAT
ncbi:hypothetical protein [Dawidia cretensis]|nr:hypothetical protein [Dawidia cretensis]